MFLKRFFIGFLLCISFSLFADNTQNKNLYQETKKVVLEAHSAISHHENSKLYIDENRLFQANEGVYIQLDSGQCFFSSTIESDAFGYYYSIPDSSAKAFKCICNKCEYEWFGGVFTVRCPSCGSTDFRSVPNWPE